MFIGPTGTGKTHLLTALGYLIRNEGSPERYELTQPVKLHANGEEIVAPKGDAAPVAADWDRDGKLDLLLGAGDGSVLWYRNIGSAQAPRLAARQTLIPAPAEDSERGIRAKICVTDWNDDGALDIVLGDFGNEFEKKLSDEEKQWRELARQQQSDLLKSWATVFQKYRELMQAPEPKQETEQRRREEELGTLRKELVQLKRVRDNFYREEQALKPGTQFHGRVWLYLRRNPSQEPSCTQPLVN